MKCWKQLNFVLFFLFWKWILVYFLLIRCHISTNNSHWPLHQWLYWFRKTLINIVAKYQIRCALLFMSDEKVKVAYRRHSKISVNNLDDYFLNVGFCFSKSIYFIFQAYLSFLWALLDSIFNIFLLIRFLFPIVCMLHLHSCLLNLRLSELAHQNSVLCFCVFSPKSFSPTPTIAADPKQIPLPPRRVHVLLGILEHFRGRDGTS